MSLSSPKMIISKSLETLSFIFSFTSPPIQLFQVNSMESVVNCLLKPIDIFEVLRKV